MTGAEYWAERPLAKCAMKLNGEYIETNVPAYRTLEVSGRHDLEADITTYETTDDGAIYKRRRQLSRTLSVRFGIKTATTEELHNALDAVNGILRAEQMEICFDDESRWTYYGSHARMTIGTLLPTYAAGEIEIFCADPYKYSPWIDGDATMSSLTEGTAVIDYKGTVPAAPIVKCDPYTDEIGGFTAELDGAQITIGDMVSPDGVPTTKPEVLDQVNFKAANPDAANWAAAAVTQAFQNYEMTGLAAVESGIGLRPTDYGSGSKWHGPSWVLNLPEDSEGTTGAENFVFSWTQRNVIPSTASSGEMIVAAQYWDASTGSYKAAMSLNVRKDSGKKSFAVYVNAGGEYLGSYEMDIDGVMDTIDCRMSYANGLYSVSWGGQKTYKGTLAAPVTRIQVVFARWGNYAPIDLALTKAQFLKGDVADWKDVPNLFPEGTNIQVDTATGKITVDGADRPDVGDLENDYEGFRLKPGLNTISYATNGWVEGAPTFAYRYREVKA